MLKVLAALGFAALAAATPLWQPHLFHASVGRNIRHLPCVSRRTGQEGTCMFAFSCAKANGTHLGTCIDRFYFGSCCKMPVGDGPPDLDALPPIEDNSLDGATTARIRPAVTQKPSTASPSTVAASTTAAPTTAASTTAAPTTTSTTPAFSSTTGSISTSTPTWQGTPKPTTVAPTFVTWTTVEEASAKPPAPPSIRPQVSASSAGTHRPILSSSTEAASTGIKLPSGTSTEPSPGSSSQRPPPPPTSTGSPPTVPSSIAPVSSHRPPVSTHRPVTAASTAEVSFQPVSTQRPPPSTFRPSTSSSSQPTSSTSSTSTSSSSTTKPPATTAGRPPPTSRPPPSSPRPPPSTVRPSAGTSRPPVSTSRPPPSSSRPPPSSSRPPPSTARPPPSNPTARPPPSNPTARPPPSTSPARPPPSSSRPPPTTARPPQVSQKPGTAARPPVTPSKPKPSQKPPSKPGSKPKPPPKPKPTAKPTTTARPTSRPTASVTNKTTTSTTPYPSTAQKPASETWVPVSVSTHEPSTTLPTDKTPATTTTQKPTTVLSTTAVSSPSPETTTTIPIIPTTPGTVVMPNLNMSNYKEVCGRRLFPDSRVVGGDKSTFGKWPWQISLRQWRTSTYLHKCGAALLNENWAITAAHCVENVPPSDLLLRLGEHDLSVEDEPYGYQERRVQIVASHPQFDPRTFEYDLALLRFYEPVAFQPNIIPICVPEDDVNFVGSTAYVTGWGRLYEDGPLPSVLQEVSVPVINNSLCETMYRAAGYIEHIPDIFICAGWKKGGFDSCEGDSGGPMVIQRPDRRWLLAGVISWGIGCAEPNQPGVYTRISQFRDWINQILQF